MITKILKKAKNSTISSLFAGIVVIMAMFMVVGCEKDETSVSDQQQTVRKPQPISDMEVMQYLPEVVDGRLVFKDSVSYVKYVKWLFENQCNTEKIYSLNGLSNFVSMQQVYDEGLKSLEQCEDVRNDFINTHKNVFYEVEVDGSIIQDMQSPPVLSYILNEYGVYQIGKKIIRVSYNYCYSIIDGDESKISVVIDAKGDELDIANVEISPVIRNVTKYGEYSYRTSYFSNTKKRIVSRLTWATVSGSGFDWWFAETNSQQKILGVWLGRQLDGVWVSWPAGYWYEWGSSTAIAISANNQGSASNQTIKIAFLTVTTGTVVDKASSWLASTHTGKDGSETRNIVYTNSFFGAY